MTSTTETMRDFVTRYLVFLADFSKEMIETPQLGRDDMARVVREHRRFLERLHASAQVSTQLKRDIQKLDVSAKEPCLSIWEQIIAASDESAQRVFAEQALKERLKAYRERVLDIVSILDSYEWPGCNARPSA